MFCKIRIILIILKNPDYVDPKICGVNQIYQSLPPSSPHNPTYWETTAAGPSTIKHLYSGIPNWYPFQKITRPVGTLYEHDYSQFHETGSGKGKRISYHYKPYPLTDRNVRETREYADVILPYMDIRNFIKYPIQRDSTLNSSLQSQPQAYIPDP
jgi:hypothetical protein